MGSRIRKAERNRRDMNIREDYKTSILECRRIYHEMTDEAFAAWYSKRYGVKANTVLELLVKEGAAKNAV